MIGNRLIIKYTNRIDNKDLIRALASVFRVTKNNRFDEFLKFLFFFAFE